MAAFGTRITVLAATFLLTIAAQVHAASSPRSPSPPARLTRKLGLVFFGDSLTDNGNVFKVAGVPDPKVYYKGRFSNGPNWVDHLKKKLSTGTTKVPIHNYAYGGGPACANAWVEQNFPFVKNLTAQVAAFAADVKSKAKLEGPKLVLQYSGSQDLLLFLGFAVANNQTYTPAEIGAFIQATVRCRVQGALQAAAVPGVTDIVILPIGPVHLAPNVPASLKPQVIAIEDVFSNLTLTAMANLNSQLLSAPAGTPGAGVRIHVLGDTRWIANGAAKVNPPFTHIDEPCFIQPRSALLITPGIVTCKDPENYLFYEQVHTTTRFHEWFAIKGVLPRLQALGLLP